MPERAEIIQKARALESHCWAQEETLKDGQVWSGRQYGARFELTRPAGVVLEDQGDVDFLLLAVRGRTRGQERLVSDFQEVLGVPHLASPSRRFSNPRTLIWKTQSAPQE